MEFPIPAVSGFVIYGKTNCSYCQKVKTLLSEYEHEYKYTNCDEYLVEHKDAFLEYIERLAGKPYRTFPMIFFNGAFIGGYTDTMKLLMKISDDE